MKNLLTIVTLLFSLSLIGQDRPRDEGPIIIVNRTTTGSSSNPVYECKQDSSVVIDGSIYLPTPLPNGTIFSTSSKLVRPSGLTLDEFDDRVKPSGLTLGEFDDSVRYNECNGYKYDFKIYLQYKGDLPCDKDVYIEASFQLLINGKCIYEYLDDIGYSECYSGECKPITVKALLCEDCQQITNGESELGNRSLKNYTNSIRPNPFTNNIYIDSSQEVDQVQIFDISGSLVKDKPMFSRRNGTVNTDDLDSGVYILKLNYLNGSNESFMMIKQ